MFSERSAVATEVFSLSELSFEYKSIFEGNRDPMFWPMRATRELNLRLDFDLFESFYMRNQVWSVMDQIQFRGVGWHYFIGSRILPFMDIRLEHFSKHLLDMTGSQGFPVEDSIAVVFYLYRREVSGRPLLKFNPFWGARGQ